MLWQDLAKVTSCHKKFMLISFHWYWFNFISSKQIFHRQNFPSIFFFSSILQIEYIKRKRRIFFTFSDGMNLRSFMMLYFLSNIIITLMLLVQHLKFHFHLYHHHQLFFMAEFNFIFCTTSSTTQVSTNWTCTYTLHFLQVFSHHLKRRRTDDKREKR